MGNGFCLLIDLSGLDHMDRACATDLGRIMDLCNERGVSKIVSVVPDPTKDIGLRLLSLFHFSSGIRIELHGNLPEAMGSLPGRSSACASVFPESGSSIEH
jgi:anti-anti-sigma regulatory factor